MTNRLAYQHLLPNNATKFEYDWAGAAIDRLNPLQAPYRVLWQPYVVPYPSLPFLSWTLSVDLWQNDWPEHKKRYVTAQALYLHSIKGTELGIRTYLDICDAELIQVVKPPEGFFASPNMSKADLDAYIAKHPKLRITLDRGYSTAPIPDGMIAEVDFVEDTTIGVDDGPALWGRRAYLYRNGVQTPLQLSKVVNTKETRSTVVTERVVVPGMNKFYSFVDEFVASDSFADATDTPAPQFYTITLDKAYDHLDSSLELSMVPIGFAIRDTRYYRESLIGDGSLYQFADQDFAECAYGGLNDGGILLADVLHLYDPSIQSPITGPGGFANVNRVDQPAYTAELRVDWKQDYVEGSAFVVDRSFSDEDPATINDTSRRDFLLDAVQSSKRLSDKIGVTFQVKRPRTWGDGIPLDGSAKFGGMVSNIL